MKLTEPTRNYGTKSTSKVDQGFFDSHYKFNVSGLSAAVQSATLRLFVTDPGAGGGAIHSVSNNFDGTSTPWTEDILTSGNAPPVTGSPLSALGAVVLGTFVELDVTAAIAGNGTYSFAITANSTSRIAYNTKEGANPPQLIIVTGSGGGGNIAPLAANDNATTNAGTSVQIDVTVNDSDSDGTINVTTVAIVTAPSNGSVSVSSVTGVVTYTPNFGFSGTDSFNYTVQDNDGATSNPALVTVTVNGAGNNAPVANNDAASTNSGVSVTIDVTSNDTDSDGTINVASVAIASPPANGTTSIDGGTGQVTYTPDAGFSGTDSFTYTVQDDDGALSNAATVTIDVTGGTAQTITLNPTDDAFVRSSVPTNNFGSSFELRVRKASAKFYSFLQFNVSGLSAPVQSATLRLYCFDSGNEGGDVRLVSNSWDEDTIVFDNSPALTSPVLDSFGAVTLGQYFEVDVTSAITGDGTFSFGIDNSSSDAAKYDSREASNPPELVITTGFSTGPELVVQFGLNEETAATATPELLPETISLSPNYPNPFNAGTNIRYALPADSKVTLQIFNVKGQLVRTLVDEEQTAGFQKTRWEGRNDRGHDVGSGVYFMQLEVGKQKFHRRIILQK